MKTVLFVGVGAMTVATGCDAVLGGFPPPVLDASTTGTGAGAAGGAGDGGEPSTNASTSSSGGGGAGGQAPTDCWNGATDFAETVVADADLAGVGPTDMVLSPDGLTLYYQAKLDAGAESRPYEVTRGNREVPFVGGMAMPLSWPGIGQTGSLWVFGDEMVIRTDADPTDPFTDWNLSLSVRAGSTWSTPVVMPAVSSTSREAWPRVVAEGTQLFYQRADGPTVEVKPGLQLSAMQLYTATRPAGSMPGTAFSATSLVSLPGFAPTDFILCLVPSWDGTRLFIGTTHGSPLGSDPNLQKAVRVFYSERPDVASEWSAPVPVDELSHPMEWTCPIGITDDGCEIVLQRTVGAGTPDASSYNVIAERAPL